MKGLSAAEAPRDRSAPDAGGTARLESSAQLEERPRGCAPTSSIAEEAKRLAGECAELAAEAAVELDRAARGGAAGRRARPGGAPLTVEARDAGFARRRLRPTRTTCARSSRSSSSSCASPASPRPRGSTRRCATRCWPAASASGRC